MDDQSFINRIYENFAQEFTHRLGRVLTREEEEFLGWMAQCAFDEMPPPV